LRAFSRYLSRLTFAFSTSSSNSINSRSHWQFGCSGGGTDTAQRVRPGWRWGRSHDCRTTAERPSNDCRTTVPNHPHTPRRSAVARGWPTAEAGGGGDPKRRRWRAERLLLGSSSPLTASPPAEQTTARED
jgi:hypothetical protein